MAWAPRIHLADGFTHKACLTPAPRFIPDLALETDI